MIAPDPAAGDLVQILVDHVHLGPECVTAYSSRRSRPPTQPRAVGSAHTPVTFRSPTCRSAHSENCNRPFDRRASARPPYHDSSTRSATARGGASAALELPANREHNRLPPPTGGCGP